MATSPFFQISHSKNMKIRKTFSLKQLMLMVNAFWIMLSRRNWEGNYGGQKCIETAIWCPSDLLWSKYVCVSWVPVKDYSHLRTLRVIKRLLRLPGDCCGPGESIDFHIVGFSVRNDKGTSAHPQCPWGPKSAQNVKPWLLRSMGVNKTPIL